jgi:hypothetical protein
MFEDLENALRGLEQTVRIPISIPLDDAGYFDRICPDGNCRHEFKVLFEDWEAKVPEERAYCPVCRHESDPTEFNTAELKAYIADVAQAYAAGLIDQTMSEAAEAFNRSQPRNSFISMSMSYEPGAALIVLPATAADAMRQKFVCETCGCRYASIGAAFFCPACGHNSAQTTFDQTLSLVRNNLATLDTIAGTIADHSDLDMAKDFRRELLEASIGRLVSAFQRLSEAIFDQLPNRSQFNPRRNVFQNIQESSDLWQQAGKDRYEDVLDPKEFRDFTILFQRRHLLQHREGVVDQAYIDKSGDRAYALGQRIVVSPNDVQRLADITQKLAQHLRQ